MNSNFIASFWANLITHKEFISRLESDWTRERPEMYCSCILLRAIAQDVFFYQIVTFLRNNIFAWILTFANTYIIFLTWALPWVNKYFFFVFTFNQILTVSFCETFFSYREIHLTKIITLNFFNHENFFPLLRLLSMHSKIKNSLYTRRRRNTRVNGWEWQRHKMMIFCVLSSCLKLTSS